MKKLMVAACAALGMAGLANAAAMNWRALNWDGSAIIGSGSHVDNSVYSFAGHDLQLMFLVNQAGTAVKLGTVTMRSQAGVNEVVYTPVNGEYGWRVEIRNGNWGTAMSPLLVDDTTHRIHLQLWAEDGVCCKPEPKAVPEPTSGLLIVIGAAGLALARKGA